MKNKLFIVAVLALIVSGCCNSVPLDERRHVEAVVLDSNVAEQVRGGFLESASKYTEVFYTVEVDGQLLSLKTTKHLVRTGSTVLLRESPYWIDKDHSPDHYKWDLVRIVKLPTDEKL